MEEVDIGCGCSATLPPKTWHQKLTARFWNPSHAPDLPHALGTHPMITQAWSGLDPTQVWDMHTHLAGTGDSGNGIEIHPTMLSWWHPRAFFSRLFYENGSGTHTAQGKDHAYVNRMANLLVQMRPHAAQAHPKALLFAFDRYYDEKGEAHPARSTFYVPNHTVAAAVRAHPQAFEWAASIHPYREDALDELEQAVADGACAIKWLPAAMNMDPDSPRCDAFYEALVRHNLPMIIHCGKEEAVKTSEAQAFGNPLKLKRLLDHGVRTVVAHCASSGDDIDLEQGPNGPRVSSFELFARMMDRPEYAPRLFGDISAIVLRNRHPQVLQTLLTRQDWHPRLLNGSDYPLPGIVPITSPSALARAGLLDKELCEPLNRVREHNPLYFDFLLKRHLQWDGIRFPTCTFETRAFFQRAHELPSHQNTSPNRAD